MLLLRRFLQILCGFRRVVFFKVFPQVQLSEAIEGIHIAKLCSLFKVKHRLEQMIKKEVSRGHNLVGRFDPYPGWDSHHLCGYEIENKTMVVEEMDDGYMVLALYQEGYDTERLYLSASDFPIEVLFNIYEAMK